MFIFIKDRCQLTKDRIKGSVNGKLRFPAVKIAFQPIVDASTARVWGYEALTRGTGRQNYPSMVKGMSQRKRIAFDKLVTMKALCEAHRLDLARNGAKITLNVRPSLNRASVDAAFIARAAKHYKIPVSSIVLELTEDAKLTCDEYREVVQLHRKFGIATAIDDFGSGYSGLNVLASCGAAVVKLDRHLVSGIDQDLNKQMIVESFTLLCKKLGAMVIAEGVETQEEAEVLHSHGVQMMQGYYFGRPNIGGPSVIRLAVGERESVRAWPAQVKQWPAPLRLSA
jgi:EAL domain-containing protein (putative c-di-GMP-specific phosphodiesterase class I)